MKKRTALKVIWATPIITTVTLPSHAQTSQNQDDQHLTMADFLQLGQSILDYDCNVLDGFNPNSNATKAVYVAQYPTVITNITVDDPNVWMLDINIDTGQTVVGGSGEKIPYPVLVPKYGGVLIQLKLKSMNHAALPAGGGITIYFRDSSTIRIDPPDCSNA